MILTTQKIDAFKQHKDELLNDLKTDYDRIMNDYWNLYKGEAIEYINKYAAKQESVFNIMFIEIERITLELIDCCMVFCEFTLKFLSKNGTWHEENSFWFICGESYSIVNISMDVDSKRVGEFEFLKTAAAHLYNGKNLTLTVYPEAMKEQREND